MILGISHVGIAVTDLEQAIDRYQQLGFTVEHRWRGSADGMLAAELVCGDARVELMQPEREDSPVGAFLASRGEGMHHVCYRVDDVAAELGRMRALGLRTVDQAPRPGGGGRTRVAFVHPKSMGGMLVELEEPA